MTAEELSEYLRSSGMRVRDAARGLVAYRVVQKNTTASMSHTNPDRARTFMFAGSGFAAASREVPGFKVHAAAALASPYDTRGVEIPALPDVEFIERLRNPTGQLLQRLEYADQICKDWSPRVPIRMYTGSADRDVPAENAESCREELDRARADVSVVDVGPYDPTPPRSSHTPKSCGGSPISPRSCQPASLLHGQRPCPAARTGTAAPEVISSVLTSSGTLAGVVFTAGSHEVRVWPPRQFPG